jgi:hypothetical protein
MFSNLWRYLDFQLEKADIYKKKIATYIDQIYSIGFFFKFVAIFRFST